jgi:hypothetical protein
VATEIVACNAEHIYYLLILKNTQVEDYFSKGHPFIHCIDSGNGNEATTHSDKNRE